MRSGVLVIGLVSLRRATCLILVTILFGLAGGLPTQSASAQETALPAPFWRTVFARPDRAEAAPAPDIEMRRRLGAALFADKRLSGDQTRSCASCHKPRLGFSDGRARAKARAGSDKVLRNTPTLFNLQGATAFNWDGSAPSLEEQALGPLQSAAELAADMQVVVTRLKRDQKLVSWFAGAFPVTPEISRDTITRALASHVRILTAPPTRFDAWIGGDARALTSKERFGFQLFVAKAGCVACHAGWKFKDDGFHDIGLPDKQTGPKVTGIDGKLGVRAFKTPTLRAVKKTAPYMHDGSLRTLKDVVAHYASGVVQRRGLSASMPRGLTLSPAERAALVAFLKTL